MAEKLLDAQGYMQKILLARIYDLVKVTPLQKLDNLSDRLGVEVHLKREDYQKIHSFKLRGAYNMIKNLSEAQLKAGIVTASAGNHAQGVALSAKQLEMKAVIVMPTNTPLVKINNTKEYGAEVILHGDTYDDAYTMAEILSHERDLYFIHPFNNVDVIAGQGTIAVEILEELNSADNIIIPVGGGGLASGVAAYLKETNSPTKIMTASMRKRRVVRVTGASFIAEGISVKTPGDITFEICSSYLDDIVTVSENNIAASILEFMERAKLVVEGAGAAPLAALLSRSIDYKDKKNILIVSGGNIDINMISRIISKGMSTSGRFLEITLNLKDSPGSLADIAKFIADEGANILDIKHDRFGAGLPIGFSRVNLELETKSREHIEQLVIALNKAGYDVTVC